MKSLSRYLNKILSRSLLLVFIVCTLFGFLMAVGVHAATSEQSSLDVRRMNSGAIQIKPACTGFNPLVGVGGLSLCSREFHEAVGQLTRGLRPPPPPPPPPPGGGGGPPPLLSGGGGGGGWFFFTKKN